MDNAVLGMGIIFAIKDAYSNEASKIQAQLAKIGGASDQMMKQVTTSLNNIKLGLAGLGIGLALASPFLIAINKAREFEQQMSNIKALGVMGSQMQEVEKLAMEMGAATKFSAIEAGQGIEELLKAGVALKDVMGKDGLSGALDLAVAGDLQLADAAEIASTALNAFRKDALTIRQAGDILAGAANASATSVGELRFGLSMVSAVASGLGLSFKDTNLALAVFAQNGLKGSDAGTSLKTMLMNLQPRSKEQLATFKQLGIITANGANQFFDASGKIRSMAEISEVLSKSLKHLTPQQRAFTLETMFGSDAVRAGNILFTEGALGINKMASEMTKFTAASVAKEKLNNFNGALEKMKGDLETTAIQVGQMFLPILTKMVKGLNVVVDVFQLFMSSQIGKFVIFLTASIAVLAIGIGGLVLVLNLAKFASFQASLAFASMGKSAIASAFMTGGLVGGLKALALSAIRATIAMMPLLLKIGLIAAPFIFAYKSLQAFREVLAGTAQPAKGLLGFMQQLGGVIWGVGQIFSSWDGKSFDLGGMEKQLKSLGILDLVVNIGTYVVRLIEFGKGLGEGFVYAFTQIYIVGSWAYQFIVDMVNNFFTMLGMQNMHIGKATSSIMAWAEAGKWIGYVIAGVVMVALVALTFQMGAFAISVIAATWPILAIIGAIAAVVAVFYYWNDIVAWFGEQWNYWTNFIGAMAMQLGQWLYDTFSGFFNWLIGIPSQMFDVGVNLVNNLWEGIKSIWNTFTTWFMDAVSSIPGMSYFLGIDEDAVSKASSIGNVTDGLGQKMADVKALSSTSTVNNTVNNTSSRGESFIFNLDLGEGETITKVVEKQQALKVARR